MANLVSRFAAAVFAVAIVASPAFAADEHVGPMKELAKSGKMSWVADPIVIAAINKQNEKNAALSQGDIDKLDKEWRSEVKGSGGGLVNRVMSSELSAFLKKVKAESAGLFTEIFVMDNKGLNVGQSDKTSDYWQGDEAKWQKTYQQGAGMVHVGGIEKDESTQTLQSQLSITIVDPASNKPIGAVTVGINVEQLP